MKPEQLVPTSELCQKLVDAGIVLDTYFNWVGDELWDKTMESDYTTRTTIARSKWIPAPTADELFAILPHKFRNNRLSINKWADSECVTASYFDDDSLNIGNDFISGSDTLANALAELAVKVKESS